LTFAATPSEYINKNNNYIVTFDDFYTNDHSSSKGPTERGCFVEILLVLVHPDLG
jgi:hypothetical protein